MEWHSLISLLTTTGRWYMALYTIAKVPLIEMITNDNVKQTGYTHYATAGCNLVSIKKWWDDLQKLGPDYGYFSNPKKI